MKRKISAVLILTMLFAFIAPISQISAAGEISEAENIVYTFLREKLGLNNAAACGIMANIRVESNFNPEAKCIDTNDLESYGIFQWNGGRNTAMKTWCRDNGFKYNTIEGQLGFFKYELETTEKRSYAAMKEIENTYEGCVFAAVEFARLFERCARFSFGLRADYSSNRYWNFYSSGVASDTRGIYGIYCNYPINIKSSKPHTIYGAVVSYTSPLKSVTVGVYDDAGNAATEYTAYPNTNLYNLSNIDRYIVFNKVPDGKYTYRIEAVSEDGYYKVEEHYFTVSSAATSEAFSEITTGTVQCGFGSYCPGFIFSDMPSPENWAHEGIDFAISKDLLRGTSATTFEPATTTTRAMLVTILYRLEGEPTTEGLSNVFEDVPDDSWFIDSSAWAAANGIVLGTSATTFSPYDAITREQMAVLLQRYTQYLNLDSLHRADVSVFPDAGEISNYAIDGLAWAIGAGIIDGKAEGEATILEPKGFATRAQISTLLKRYIENIVPTAVS